MTQMRRGATLAIVGAGAVLLTACPFSKGKEKASPLEPENPKLEYPRCVMASGPTTEFGDTIIGFFKEQTIQIRNANTAIKPENQFAYEFLVPSSSPDCGAFSFPGDPPTGLVSAGGSADVTVRFSPTEEHSYTCKPGFLSLRVSGGSATNQQIANPCPSTLSWSGTGNPPPPPPVVWDECNTTWDSKADLHGVYSIGALSNIYAAGEAGTILVGNGECGWAQKTPNTASVYTLNVTFTDLWVRETPIQSEYVVWAVGNRAPEPGTYTETGTIVRYWQNPSVAMWSEYEPGWLITYGSVWGSGSADIWFGGLGVSTDFPNARHYDGTGFETLQIDLGMSEITSIHGTVQDNVWAVLNQSYNSIYHFDGTTWTSQHQSFMNQPLHDVWASPGGHVYAVGVDGAIYHFDGSTWVDESIDTTTDLFGVWANYDTPFAIAVGENGVIYHRIDGVWTLQSMNLVEEDYTLRDVWGYNERWAFAVGDDGQILKLQEVR